MAVFLEVSSLTGIFCTGFCCIIFLLPRSPCSPLTEPFWIALGPRDLSIPFLLQPCLLPASLPPPSRTDSFLRSRVIIPTWKAVSRSVIQALCLPSKSFLTVHLRHICKHLLSACPEVSQLTGDRPQPQRS